jgi:HEAT repeat protein
VPTLDPVVPLVALLLGAAAGPAQFRAETSAEHVPAWIAELGDARTSDRALRMLAAAGASAVAGLAAAVADESEPAGIARSRRRICARGRIGPPAASAAPVLIEALDGADRVLERQVLWALGAIGAAAERHVPDLRAWLDRYPLRARENWLEFGAARCRLGLDHGTQDSSRPACSIATSRSGSVRRTISSRIPSSATRSARSCSPRTTRPAHTLRLTLALALAVGRCLPDARDPVALHAILLRHHDPDVRLEAARELRDIGVVAPAPELEARK